MIPTATITLDKREVGDYHFYTRQSKVILKVILKRLKSQAEEITAEEQAGVRAGRSNMEQIFSNNTHSINESHSPDNTCIKLYKKYENFRILCVKSTLKEIISQTD